MKLPFPRKKTYHHAKAAKHPYNRYAPFAKVRLAIAQNQQLRESNPTIINMLPGSILQKGVNTPAVDIHVHDEQTAEIPRQLTARFPDGRRFTVPVQIIHSLGHARSQARAGDTLTNSAIAGCAPGTLCCLLKDGAGTYALTCCHVLTNDQLAGYTGYDVPAGNQVQSAAGPIGTWSFGIMNSTYDIGYITLTTAASAGGWATPRDIEDADVLDKTPIHFSGASTPAGTGLISNYQCSRTLHYGDSPLSIDNLILITNATGDSPSQSGDSGALVVTNKKEPIGMIIGADLNFTYAIPITSILSVTGKTIY